MNFDGVIMNRRTFMKAVGMAVAGLSTLPFSTPTPLSKIIIAKCPACAAGMLSKKVGWIVYGPQAVIMNDRAITKITLTDNEAEIGFSNTDHNILCGHVGSELHISDPSKAGEEAGLCYAPYDQTKRGAPLRAS